eukprot:NODE_4679_length_776_cov_66.053645_g4335_i0.p1 GENE.NODE_4679_length_776_cov_66.053645_g4335_i0~~NODE_4679_length_776_cov_66.053645_g4335_i0.p1  ORF type:complete len:133 (-),score=15.18 NODE_4679_length_776_cov_66.053645_g4335_i0:322-720(-)
MPSTSVDHVPTVDTWFRALADQDFATVTNLMTADATVDCPLAPELSCAPWVGMNQSLGEFLYASSQLGNASVVGRDMAPSLTTPSVYTMATVSGTFDGQPVKNLETWRFDFDSSDLISKITVEAAVQQSYCL